MRAGPGYSHAAHMDAAIKASKARNGARVVLLEAIRRADFGKPETTFTKDQIVTTTGLCLRTVRMALCDLRAEGVLVPVRNYEGGRGKAVTYRIVNLGGQDGEAPSAKPEKVPAALFGQWVSKHGYAEARRRQAEIEGPRDIAAE